MALELPFGLAAAPPAVRRPRAELTLGAAGPADWAPAVLALTLHAGCAPAVDVLEVVARAGPGVPEAALGDPVALALGYDDEAPVPVFRGEVDGVRHGLRGTVRITGAGGGAALAALRVDRAYEGRAAGAIAADLAAEAGVATGAVEDGIQHAYYVVDGRRSAWAHVAALARRSGFLARSNPDGALVFGAPATGAPARTFSFAADLLALDVAGAPPLVARVTTVGEGAAGSQGAEAWSWLAKDPAPVTGKAGAGDPHRLVPDASLRSGDAARAAAEGLLAAAGGLATGTLLVPGAPGIGVGARIEVAGAPGGALDGGYVVRWLRHRLTSRTGLTTLAGVARAPGGGLPGGLG